MAVPPARWRNLLLLIRGPTTRSVPVGPALQDDTFTRVRGAGGCLSERLMRLRVQSGPLKEVAAHAGDQWRVAE